MQSEWVTTTRECTALLVPEGSPITIPEGARVLITQSLGDSFTVNIQGNLARIEGKDADALGKEAAGFHFDNVPDDGTVNEEHVWEVLKTCYDPEIPVNIVDLGLIYGCEIDGGTVRVKMTLTAPGCGMGPVIADEVRHKLMQVPNVEQAEVELVFDPPWNQSMLSEVAKVELGLM